jgi:hypothetical protein
MDDAAKRYLRALDDRDITRRRPPHDIMALQNAVKNYAARVAGGRADVKRAVAAQFGPTRSGVTRPSTMGVYVARRTFAKAAAAAAVKNAGAAAAKNELLVRRQAGRDAGSSLAFWSVNADAPRYLERRGRSWAETNAANADPEVSLDEHWAASGGGLR